MVAPALIPALSRLLITSGKPSVRSLVTTIYNKSGKALSQKRLWELAKSRSGIRELERIYNSASNADTLTSLTKKLKELKLKPIDLNKALDKANSQLLDSIEVRGFLATKVLARIRSEGKGGLKAKPFLVKLAKNILSGSYSTSGFELSEIIDYIDNTTLTDMIATFKTEALYYG